MRLFRLFIATLWLLTLGLSAAPAHAGTINVALPSWTKRPGDRLINLLNRQDCLNDAVASFSIQFVGVPTGAFEVWSGTGCDQAANRQTTTVIQNCVRVSGSVPLSTINQTVTIRFRDMVAVPGTTPNADIAECNSTQSVGLLTRTLYFVVFDANTQATIATGTNTAWAFKYDISAPPPPTGVAAQSGDGSLVTTFTPPAGETNLLHYHFYCSPQGPPPAMGTAGSAGTAATATGGAGAATGGAGAATGGAGAAGIDTGGLGGTAGADAGGLGTGGSAGTDATAGSAGTGGTDATAAGTGGTAGTAGTDATAGTAGTAGSAGAGSFMPDPNCTSLNNVLEPGQPPPAGAIDCGTIGAQGATGGETNPVLGNDSGYAVAVATEDTVNNVGVLSTLACGTPKDITGFFEAYRKAGGEGGGGYCTFGPAHTGAVAGALGFLLGACALLARRRR